MFTNQLKKITFALLVTSFAFHCNTILAQAVQSPNQAQIAELESQLEVLMRNKSLLETGRTSVLQDRDNTEKKWKDLLLRQDELGISREAYPEVVSVLQSQRVQLLIDESGLKARQAALTDIQDQIAKQQADSKSELIDLLTDLVEKNRVRVERLRKVGDAVSDAEIRQAEESLLQSEVRLEEAKISTGREAHNFSEEALSIALDLAETRARLTKVNQLLQDSLGSRDIHDQLQKLEDIRDGAAQTVTRIEAQILQLQQEIDSVQSKIDLLNQDNY